MIRYAVRSFVRNLSWSIYCRTSKRAHMHGWPARANAVAFRAYCWAVPVKWPRLG